MRNKTKWIAAMLCMTLYAGMAIGSGSSDSGETKEITAPGDTSEAEKKEASEEKGKSEEKQDTDKDKEESPTPTITEQVLIDTAGVKITAREYVTDTIWGDGIKLLIENNSDQDLTIGCDALIVNDYMISDLFAEQVAAGKSANETMHLSSSGLKAAGISSVGRIEMYFHASDSEYNTLFSNEYAEIHTSEYDNMDTSPNDAGRELYNADGIKIVGKTVDENSFWGTAILLYIENNSGKNIGISADDMSINGFMVNAYLSTTIYNEKKAIDDITIMSSDLEENGIESIDNVELKFHIFDADSYSTITDTEPITFSAK